MTTHGAVATASGRGEKASAHAEAAASLQRLASRLDDHADGLALRRALLIGARDAACAGVGERVEAVRSVAADLRLAAARLRAGTLPARGARAG